MHQRIINFLRAGIWQFHLARLPRHKAALIRLGRMILMSARGFLKDRCPLNASALTFYSLLSIVPVLAMIFGFAKGFKFEEQLKAELMARFAGQEEVFSRIIGFAEALLNNTKGGIMAGIGIAVLLWTVIRLMSHIERSFNDIWDIRRARGFGRKFADYLAFIIITPVLFFLSSSATVYVTTQITQITERVSLVGAFAPVIFSLLKFSPYVIIWALFSLMYMLMPNTRVRFFSGLLGGIVAGTIFQLVQWGYINFQIGIARNNAIYGSFAALPLFLVWLQTSWVIVLFGAELAYAHQCVDTFEFEPNRFEVNHRHKQLVALQIAHLVVQRFATQLPPFTIPKIAAHLQLPLRLTRQVADELIQAGIFTQINNNEYKEPALQPGLDTDQLTIHYVINAMETIEDSADEHQIVLTRYESANKLDDTLKTFYNQIKQLPENRPLKEI